MMNVLNLVRPAVAAVILFASTGAAAPGSQQVTALSLVERGQWQLRGASGDVRKLCLTAPAALLQIRHGGANCERVVMENSARSATVRYTCPGHGQGRTEIRVETPRLIQIDTQGVSDGSPFAEQYEGRLTGACG